MTWNRSSGVLCKMLGPEVSDAARLLPPAGPDQPKTATVEMDTAQTGRVRVTLECRLWKHYKMRHWGWHAIHAERIDGKVQ